MKNQDYYVSYEKITKKEKKTFNNLTCFFLVKGSMVIHFNNQYLTFEPGDFIFINMNDTVEIVTLLAPEVQVFKLSIANVFLLKRYEAYLSSRFKCHSLLKGQENEINLNQLKQLLSQLIIQYFSADKTKYLKVAIHLQEILLILIDNFQINIFNSQQFRYSDKLTDVFEYIHMHYKEPIKLEDVANDCFMSSSTLSRVFQEQTGIKFNTYINELRIQMSLNDLLYTADSIDKIAHNYGFTNSKTYRVQFKRLFEASPTEYKNTFFSKETKNSEKNILQQERDKLIEEDLEILLKYVGVKPEKKNFTESNGQKATLHIESDHVREQGHSEVIVHVNSLEDLFLDEIKKQLMMIKKEMGCHYIGIRSLFTEPPSSYTVFQQTKMSLFSPFSRFDIVIDFLRQNNFGVYYQLSLTDYGQVSSFYKQDHQEFFKYIEYMTRNEFLPGWRIAIRFEKQEIKKGTKAFKELREKIKRINPQISVGVELPIGYPDYSFKTKEEETVFRKEVLEVVEFVSYESEPNFVVEELDLSQFDSFVTKDVQSAKNRLKSWGVDLPFVLSEWNTLTGNTRYKNSYFFRAALIVHELAKLEPLVDSYGFWLNTFLFEGKHHSAESVRYDGLELFHYYNCRRPVYFSLNLYKRLRGNVIAMGSHFILTTLNGHYQLLTWNAQYFSPNLSLNENYLKNKTLELEINSSNVPNGLYQVKKFTLSKNHGATVYAYDRFSSQQILDEEAHQYLSYITHPKMDVFDKKFEHGLEFKSLLEPNDVCLYEFFKLED
ncbi:MULTISPECIES: helix-turn-helix domain-containing protein [Vagococcus]|uniref:Transcriptional regulator, AraC family n=1 Tax=Vagococcus fluvialis bH819 TaxID=1255619 RepID=A0A1X6WSH0_9ENTE|nr:MULTISPECIES: helix-turn-helix domain-containing protein [Vagococcus]SLM87240.1 Transcriptional regulator, AraC family [Vagococcus fluvialis bH819]HCM89094.1 hypothetical protein [Vagococcus sp.]